MYLTLKRVGLNPRSIVPPAEPLASHEIGLTRDSFMIRGEHDYWLRLVGELRDGFRVARTAGVERSTIYKRFKACSVSTRLIRTMLRRKLQFGNDAWRELRDN